jgi:hypothetical protein
MIKKNFITLKQNDSIQKIGKNLLKKQLMVLNIIIQLIKQTYQMEIQIGEISILLLKMGI